MVDAHGPGALDRAVTVGYEVVGVVVRHGRCIVVVIFDCTGSSLFVLPRRVVSYLSVQQRDRPHPFLLPREVHTTFLLVFLRWKATTIRDHTTHDRVHGVLRGNQPETTATPVSPSHRSESRSKDLERTTHQPDSTGGSSWFSSLMTTTTTTTNINLFTRDTR